METIIAVIITGTITIIGFFVSNRDLNKNIKSELEKIDKSFDYEEKMLEINLRNEKFKKRDEKQLEILEELTSILSNMLNKKSNASHKNTKNKMNDEMTKLTIKSVISLSERSLKSFANWKVESKKYGERENSEQKISEEESAMAIGSFMLVIYTILSDLYGHKYSVKNSMSSILITISDEEIGLIENYIDIKNKELDLGLEKYVE